MAKARERRFGYDAIAAQYDRARPGYPAALFTEIINYAQLGEGGRIFEIGGGSGQATLPLARRGYAIDCVELGEAMAALARERLSAYPAVSVQHADFDSMTLPKQRYDLALSATAFHWLDPDTRFQRVHSLLKPGAALALFWHLPVLTARSREYFEALQAIYQRVVPALARDFTRPPAPEQAQTDYEQLIPASKLFQDLAIHKYYVATAYDAAGYCDLLGTFSDHRALPATPRRRLLHAVATVIENDFANSILRETVALLYLARRRAHTALPV